MKIYDFKSQLENHKEYCGKKINLISKPIVENIELISLCNLNCKMCVIPPKRKSAMLSLNQIKDIVEQNYDFLKGESVWLHHFGEPLLHPDLIEIIKYLVSKDINPRLSTNAVLLDEKMSINLIKSGLNEIVFSVDTLDKEKFKYYRGVDLDLVMNNVSRFLELKKKLFSNTPITQVQCINIEMDENQVEEYIRFWKKTAVNYINIKRPSTRSNLVQCKETRKKIESRLNVFRKKNEFPCFWLWKSVVILSNGDVILCCGDLGGHNVIGNVFKKTLSDIWNSKHMQNLRALHLRADFSKTPLCEFCPEIISYQSTFEQKLEQEAKRERYDTSEILLNHHRIIENAKEIY